MPIILQPTTSGKTLSELRTRVLENSFSPGRYTTIADDELNDGVYAVCRRLGLFRSTMILAYAADGVVSMDDPTFWRIESVYLTSSGIDGDEGDDVAGNTTRQLEPLPSPSPAYAGTGDPIWYTARRHQPTDGSITLLTLLPCQSSGLVAITGLRRPPLMVDDTDVSGLGDDLDRAIVAYARARCFEIEDDAEMAQYWDGRFEQVLREVSMSVVQDGPKIAPGAFFGGFLADRGR